MPNWCFTSITFAGPDASRFHDDLESWQHEAIKSDFGSSWLGNVAINSGLIKEDEVNNDDTPRLRGSITYVDDVVDDSFMIETETAWCCMTRVFAEIIKKLKYRLSISFFSEEPGCCFYVSNDPVIVGTYRYEYLIKGLDDDCSVFDDDVSQVTAAEVAKKILQIKKKAYSDSESPKELISKAENVDLDDDEYVSFDQYEFCSEWEF
ncbi:MAG: hypothetical protein K6A70_07560 [Erysipelotrichaceae bacterium]|nr:hypothetical protein [Erysipelotrichaceae bacterium]